MTPASGYQTQRSLKLTPLDTSNIPCIIPCMATKTISLEIDAYEKLRVAKLRERESFSSVVRRAVFPAAAHTGAAVLEKLTALGAESLPSRQVFTHWEKIRREDRQNPRVSPSPWDRPRAS